MTKREHLLDRAQKLIQTRGYNAFSYRDLAQGITTASIHYHFPAKSDLGRAVVARHCAVLTDYLAALDRDVPSCKVRLDRFADLFRDTLNRDFQMCLCGMLAAEEQTLPEELNAEVRKFFVIAEAWLVKTLREGSRAGEFHPRGNWARRARVLLAALEGAMLIARLTKTTSRLDEVLADTLGEIRNRD